MLFEEYPGQEIIPDQLEETDKEPKNPEILKDSEIPKDPEQKLQQTVDSIKTETYEYWSFFRNYPNDFHEEIDRSLKGMFSETAEAVGGIPEKKINGFDMSLDDGKNVRVIEDNGTMTFTFFGEGNNNTTITLSNFKNIWNFGKDGGESSTFGKGQETLNDERGNEDNSFQGGDEQLLAAPKITIDGNTQNLPDFMQNLKSLQGGNTQIELSSNNTESFMEIFESLNDRIIKPKLLEFHGYVDNVRKNIEESLDKEEHADNWYSVAEKNDFSFPEDLDVFIGNLCNDVDKYGGFQLDANKVLLSLCVLLRSSNKKTIYNEMNRRLGYEANKGINKKGETLLGENAVEFLPFSGEEFDFFIMNSDVLIDFAKEEASLQKDEKIRKIEREMEEYQSNSSFLGGTITMRDDGLNRNRQVMTKIDPVLSEKQREKENIQIKTNLILDFLNK